MNRFFAFLLTLLIAASAVADDAVNRFNAAKQAFDAGQFTQARTGFEGFLTSFPNHAQSAEASFYLAESYLRLQLFDQAAAQYSKLISLGTENPCARAALFRIGEVPYLQGRYDLARPRLEEFVEKLPLDSNNQFTLYYLGDIALQENIPLESEFYFSECLRLYPQGERLADTQLGLALARNRLGKTSEADQLFQQLTNSTNPTVAETATYQWGVAQYERGAYQQAMSTLANFQARWPRSGMFPETQRVLARCKGELGDFNGALAIIDQITQPTTEDLLLKVKSLYGLKRSTEAQNLLTSIERNAEPAYRDEITLLKSIFLFDQKNWASVISLLDPMLAPQYTEATQRLVFNYFVMPSGGRKLSEESYLKACSLLTLASANKGDTAKANAAMSEMSGYAGLTGGTRLQNIVSDTSSQLNLIAKNPSSPGGSGRSPYNPYPGGNTNPGGNPFGGGGNVNPGGNPFDTAQNTDNDRRGGRRGDRSDRNPDWNRNNDLNPRLGADATELDKFQEASTQYDRQNWSSAAQILESLLNVQYSSWGAKQFYFNFVPSTAIGSLDETTFFRACSLAILCYARLGDMDRANAATNAMAGMIRSSDFSQQTLLRQTKEQLAEISRNASPPGGAGGYPGGTGGPTTPTTPTDLLSDTEQRRILQDCNSMYKLRKFEQLDEKLRDLMNRSASPAMKSEAALLRAKVALERKKDREALELLQLIVNDFPETDQNRDALWFLGLYYEDCGDTSRSIEYFQRLVDESPNDKNIDGALYFLAWDDIENNGGRKAATYLNRVYRSYPNGRYWSHATWTLAWLAFKKKDYSQAELYVQKVLQHPPDYAILDRVLYLKGELSLQRKDFDMATTAFREVSRLCPDSPLRDNADRNAQIAARATVSVK